MKEISFTLSKELQMIDSQGENYIYKATKHPTADDLLVVHYMVDGVWYQANYEQKEFDLKVKQGHWILN